MKTKAKQSPKRNHAMGRFSVEVQLANNADIIHAEDGSLSPEKVRRVTVPGVVDSGATRLVLPKSVADALGLRTRRKVRVRYADGRRGFRNEVGGVHLTLQGRDDVFSAVVEPKRDTALIGAIVLEDLDFLVDCIGQKLTPRDPDFIVNEIE